MRDYEEVKSYLEAKGFRVMRYTPGQSWRNGGAVFYYRPEEFEGIPIVNVHWHWAKGDRKIDLPASGFHPEIRGHVSHYRRTLELVRIIPGGDWRPRMPHDHSEYEEEMEWSGTDSGEYESLSIVRGKPNTSDLEELTK